jgi:hypothetical protein
MALEAGAAPIMQAASAGGLLEVVNLLEADPSLVHHVCGSSNQWTPLHVAAIRGKGIRACLVVFDSPPAVALPLDHHSI